MTARSPWAGATGPRHYRRLVVLTVLLLAAFGVLGARLVDLQWIQHEGLRERAENQRTRTVREAPLRGRILDRNHLTLAESTWVRTRTVVADPQRVQTNAWLLAQHLAGRLGVDAAELANQLQPRKTRVSTKDGVVEVPVRHVVLKRRVSPAEWARVEESLRELPVGDDAPGLSAAGRRERRALRQRLASAVTAESEAHQERVYPCRDLAAHVLGFVGANPVADTNQWADKIIGVEGLERSMNNVLRGVPGRQEVEKIRRGRRTFMEMGDGFSARPGLNVVLTVDAALQRIVETELASAFERYQPISVSCVVVRPRTGEVLALANVPTFDPQRPGSDPSSRRNRVVADEHEPGSTFKVITLSGALDAGVVDLNDRVDCERGRFTFHRVSLGDVHPNDVLTIEQVLAKSSNIGAAKVGIRMGEGLLYRSITNFGIGSATGIPLPGERRGTLHATNRWSKISVAWIPMGHGVAATPLQMTMAMAAVANGGRMMRPMLVSAIEDESGAPVQVFGPVMERQAVRPETAAKVVQALKLAVRAGTGTRAQMEEYVVAGKTGTAQKPNPAGGYWHDKDFVSFIGFLPADQPELCIGVFMDEPHANGAFAGETAAPVFKSIAGRAAAHLGLPPSAGGETPAGRLAQNAATAPKQAGF